MRYILLIFPLLFGLCFPEPAAAHRPYVEKKGMFKGADGKNIIVEHLYGDGIFAKDPMRVQLRHENGGLIAATNVTDFGFAHCKTLDYCYLATYGTLLPFPHVMQIDVKNISYPPVPLETHDENEKNKWRAYHQGGKEKHLSSIALDYPELFKNSQQGLKEASLLVQVAFIPLVIFYNLHLVAFGFIIGYISHLFGWLMARGQKTQNKTRKAALYFTGILFFALYGVSTLLLVLLLGLYQPPLFTLIGLWLGMRKHGKKNTTTPPMPESA